MAVNSTPDRDTSYMKSMWGTTKLVTDYRALDIKPKRRIYSPDYCEYLEDKTK